VSVPLDDEGSFSAGRQALLDALQSLEQRAHDRAERMVRDAERTARQLTLDSEQRAYQLTTEAEERARQILSEAEQRAKQVTLDTASRLADLEQQLGEVRDNMEAARAQIEDQVVSVRGQVEVARASLNTIRQQLTSEARRGRSRSRRGPIPCLDRACRVWRPKARHHRRRAWTRRSRRGSTICARQSTRSNARVASSPPTNRRIRLKLTFSPKPKRYTHCRQKI